MSQKQLNTGKSERKIEPRWLNIAATLRERITNDPNQEEGNLSDIALANEFKVSTAVIRQAVGQLVEEGLLTRQRGRGTFIRQKPIQSNLRLENFSAWAVQGHTVSVEILERRVVAANITLAAGLGLRVGAHLTFLKRLRSSNGLPVAYDHRYIPAELTEGIENSKFEEDAIWSVLSHDKGVHVAESTFTVKAAGATAEAAEMLHVEVGSPVLEYEVKVVDSRGRIVILGTTFCHPDRFVSQTIVRSNGRGY